MYWYENSAFGNHRFRKLALVFIDGVDWKGPTIQWEIIRRFIVGDTNRAPKRDIQDFTNVGDIHIVGRVHNRKHSGPYWNISKACNVLWLFLSIDRK
ncbi:hypothetical protein EYC80_007305 [Monilinia laxa]|uniref:Uncharacterized protein n=1 Tax=Monilinia laxa TaxID=61186 RepID=A0A5N6JU94_MONLA|nr:hypothetical protein EYC80_007305 [Monilinia laxa]